MELSLLRNSVNALNQHSTLKAAEIAVIVLLRECQNIRNELRYDQTPIRDSQLRKMYRARGELLARAELWHKFHLDRTYNTNPL